MTETPQQAYISKVHLKGYKSIRDLEIDFKPGLNIIIGPNGSGKTNFLEFLHRQFNNNRKVELDDNNTEITFHIDKTQYENHIKSEIQSSSDGFLYSIDDKLYKEKKTLFHRKTYYNEEGILTSLEQKVGYNEKWEIFKEPLVFVRHGNLLTEALTKGSSFQIKFTKKKMLFVTKVKGIYPSSFKSNFEKATNPGIDNLAQYFLFEKNIIDILKKYSPIQDVKFDTKIIHQYKELDGNVVVDNIFLLFKINNNWLQWTQLSDGTKRLFYILTYILDLYSKRKIFFLEEPELGIHPDQLHKLMDFLIEQSKEKQIIITTHSPEVLNAIHPDELDRIIVTRYDADKGTIMHKLTPEQAKEMGERVKEGDMFLSDRWVHLNLEDEIFNATKLNEK